MTRAGRPASLLLFVVLLFAPAAPAAAQTEGDGPVQEGALFLLLPPDPRAVSMGRAVTALPGPESVWWNPAGLAEMDENRFLVFRGENVATGDATSASLTLARPGLGAVGVSYELLDFGDIPLTDPQGNTVGSLSLRQHVGVLTVATQLFDHLSVGLNAKLVQDRPSCRGSGGECATAGITATSFAVDAGVQAHGLGGHPLRLGALLANAGPDFQVRNEAQADPLPTRLRLAVAYDALERVVPRDDLDLWLTVEVDQRWRDPGEDPGVYLGSEFVAGTGRQVLRLRAGYVVNSDAQVDGAAVGLALRYESFDLALAKSLASSIVSTGSEPVHVSFGFVF